MVEADLAEAGKGAVKERITDKLKSRLIPLALEVVDESHLHAGHAGHDSKGESHFRVKVVSDAFAGKSRVERHRIINSLLAEELAGGVHALSITARAPDETR
jgi:BolA protein